MKKLFVLFAFALVSALPSMAQKVSAQTTAKEDSVATCIMQKTLQEKKEKLLREIKVQDAKRNKQIEGVSVETMEEMNDKQDSLCLALRSELVDVILEIKEISPNVASPQLINQYNNLIHRQDSNVPQPAKPTKKNATIKGK